MYSKAEVSQTKHSFWIVFGRYMAPNTSSEGLKVNWINYKTGFKNLHFKMEADTKKASISIEITHPEVEVQAMFYEYFLELKQIFRQMIGEWKWEQQIHDEYGRTISRISTEIIPVNVMDKNDWPQIISFFKPRIIALD
ncbi:MAG: DUF4268 domain-containing protein, partial [Bacteroidetes bacterium]|nr:DUF4268 domain-containing protein [Bacteroidota bacterium]